jgi:PAS domain S-box-containing protein
MNKSEQLQLKEEIRQQKTRIKELAKVNQDLQNQVLELGKNEKKFCDLIEFLPQTVYEMDLDGYLRFTNQYGFQCFGYTIEDFQKGINFLQLFIPEDRPCVQKNINAILAGGQLVGNEYTCLRKDGSTFQSLFYSNPIFYDGKPIGLRGVVIDITDRKITEHELKNSRDQLRDLASHLQSIREEERLLMAREIHDELGQALTALKMDLIWLQKRVDPMAIDKLEKLKSMDELVDQTIKTVHRISTELRPGLIDDLGLSAAMEWYCGEFQNRTGISCQLNLDESENTLEQDRSIAVFRIFQESLTNIARHANATVVSASLKFEDGSLKMEIRDNGSGITEEQINSPKSFGLIGLRERVTPWGGKVLISGVPGQGTTVKVVLPIN